MEHFHINFEFSPLVRDLQQETEQVHTFLYTFITATLTEPMTISSFKFVIDRSTFLLK